MLPGLCSLRRIFMCAEGISSQGKTSDMQGSSRRSIISLLAAEACARWAKCAALQALLMHPHVAHVEGAVVAGRAGADHDHAALLHHQRRDREGRLARVFEDHVDTHALAGDVPDRLAEAPRLFQPFIVFGVFTVGSWPQQLKSLRLMTPLAPNPMTKSRLSSSEITPIALAPAVFTSWIA
jgi:hypothetical protein